MFVGGKISWNDLLLECRQRCIVIKMFMEMFKPFSADRRLKLVLVLDHKNQVIPKVTHILSMKPTCFVGYVHSRLDLHFFLTILSLVW